MNLDVQNLNKKLDDMRKEVEAVAKECGLDFFPTIYQVTDSETLNYVMSQLGFPLRYQHWRFGMEYESLQRQLGYGFGRLYELVINSDPAVAYLLDYNSPVQQKMVMAHVCAHVDFFKNNYRFENTDRNMINTMADHAERIKGYIERVGLEKVEAFIEAAVSIEDLIDPYLIEGKEFKINGKPKRIEPDQFRIPTDKPYLDEFINKDEYIKGKFKEEIEKIKNEKRAPQRDVLKFLIEHADKLKDWERGILTIVREESYYFQPQRETKIMNEGWAVYWHSYIMANKGLAGPEGIIEYAQTHSEVVPIGGVRKNLNPYVLGFLLYLDIKDRWDKGKHGKEYNEEEDYYKKLQWDKKEGKGLEKIFEVRKTKTDIEFLREFLTPEFVRKHQLFIHKKDEEDGTPRISDRDAKNVKKMLLYKMTNHGEPIMSVEDGDFNNAKELCLTHKFLGMPLDMGKAERTIANLYRIWGRPVHIKSVWKDKRIRITYDGKSVTLNQEEEFSEEENATLMEEFDEL